MAHSGDPNKMKAFGYVMNEMMDWFIANKSDAAMAWIEKLDSIKWNNYLTQKEAERIVSEMKPEAPWNIGAWTTAMEASGFEMEEKPFYNRCALFVTMSMIMSDSSEPINEFIDSNSMFEFVYKFAVSKLKDYDGKFKIRNYFLK